MITRYKNYSITKNKFKKDEKQPDYKMSIKVGESFAEVSACWLKDTKDGAKYFSGKMQDTWVDHSDNTKTRDGFCIVSEKELDKLEKDNTIPETKVDVGGDIPF